MKKNSLLFTSQLTSCASGTVSYTVTVFVSYNIVKGAIAKSLSQVISSFQMPGHQPCPSFFQIPTKEVCPYLESCHKKKYTTYLLNRDTYYGVYAFSMQKSKMMLMPIGYSDATKKEYGLYSC
jgi:hypothetical protein